MEDKGCEASAGGGTGAFHGFYHICASSRQDDAIGIFALSRAGRPGTGERRSPSLHGKRLDPRNRDRRPKCGRYFNGVLYRRKRKSEAHRESVIPTNEGGESLAGWGKALGEQTGRSLIQRWKISRVQFLSNHEEKSQSQDRTDIP